MIKENEAVEKTTPIEETEVLKEEVATEVLPVTSYYSSDLNNLPQTGTIGAVLTGLLGGLLSFARVPMIFFRRKS